MNGMYFPYLAEPLARIMCNVYRVILIFLNQFIPQRVTGNQGLLAFFSLNSETNFANISWQFDISSLQEARDHPV